MNLVQSFVRVGNIARMTETGSVDPALFVAQEEGALHSAYENVIAARAEGADTLPAEQELAQAIDAFFDAVMVMDKDERIRKNRLTLLKAVDNYLLQTADYSKIVLN